MAAVDRFSSLSSALTSPATHAEAVTPSDSVELTNVSRALWIGGAGNLAVVTAEGETVTFASVGAGTLLALRVQQVLSTGTTATLIVAMD